MRAAERYTNPVIAAMAVVLACFVVVDWSASKAPPTNPAVEAAERLVRDSPSAANQNNLALAYYAVGRMADSAKAAREAIALDPHVALYFNNLCAAENTLGEYDAALAACESALKLEPALTIAANNRNWALSHKAKR